MNHVDAWITREVIRVEGNDLPNSVHLHCNDKPRVMRFLPGDAAINDQPTPLVIEFWRVTKNRTQFSDACNYPGGLARREPKPVCTRWTGNDRPKFAYVLGNDAYPVSASSDNSDCVNCLPMVCGITMDTPN